VILPGEGGKFFGRIQMASKMTPRFSATLIFGLLFIFWGSLQLLDRLGIVDQEALWRFWPVALVVIGLAKILSPGESGRFWGAMFLIAGAILLTSNLGYTIHGVRIRFWDLWPLLFIAIGVNLIWNVLTRSRRSTPNGKSISTLNEFTVFGGGERRINAPDFRGGEVCAIFGGYEIDLTKAGIEGQEAELEATAVFGGVEIRVPEDWNVTVKGVGIFGGFSDKTNQRKIEGPAPHLIVKGVAAFGGVEVKN
jgi:predicted membrane protein